MLILSRREGESIVITVGDVEIKVMVVESGTDKIRLGFDAPKEVKINRSEVQQAIIDKRGRSAREIRYAAHGEMQQWRENRKRIQREKEEGKDHDN